jgi:hypothetical protein
LDSQADLVSLHRRQIALSEGLHFRLLALAQVLRILAERPSGLLELRTDLSFPTAGPVRFP